MSESSHSRRTASLQNPDLMCKNGCGFFGNPEWEGYCSKCYRELNQKLERANKKSSKRVQRSYSDVQDHSPSLGFSKFEEKKKQQTEKRTNTLKTIIKRGTLKESTVHSPSKDVFHIGDSLNKDLQLKDSVMKDVVKNIKHQLDNMTKFYDKSTDDQSEAMQQFYNFMFNRAETHNIYQDLSSEQIDQLMDKIEELLMNHMHKKVIQQIFSEHEEKDLALQKRIRSLNWITPLHLGLDIKENSPEVRDLIDKAITDVIEMDSKVAPQEKINCIVKCSKSIFDIINLCQGVTASADEFLPTMVYIVLKANPPLLQSNIKYITNYSIPARLRSGEGAYYFTNLCCAVAFIDNLTAESLTMSEEEFHRYMSGEIPLSNIEHDATASEGLRLMTQNLNSLTAIQDKSNQVMRDMLLLKNDLLKFEETVRKCKSTPPLVISNTPYTVPSNVDMSLIPEVLRNRIVRAPVEAVLVDLDSKTELPPYFPSSKESVSLMDSSEAISNGNCIEPNFQNVSLEKDSKAFDSSVPVNNLTDIMQQLHVALPVATAEFNQHLDVATSSIHSSQSLQINTSINPQYVNIQDLEYPTDLFSDTKTGGNDVEFGPFESCETAESTAISGTARGPVNPLSPESSFLEENWQLPPPLQPVVVRNPNLESSDT